MRHKEIRTIDLRVGVWRHTALKCGRFFWGVRKRKPFRPHYIGGLIPAYPSPDTGKVRFGPAFAIHQLQNYIHKLSKSPAPYRIAFDFLLLTCLIHLIPTSKNRIPENLLIFDFLLLTCLIHLNLTTKN